MNISEQTIDYAEKFSEQDLLHEFLSTGVGTLLEKQAQKKKHASSIFILFFSEILNFNVSLYFTT